MAALLAYGVHGAAVGVKKAAHAVGHAVVHVVKHPKHAAKEVIAHEKGN